MCLPPGRFVCPVKEARRVLHSVKREVVSPSHDDPRAKTFFFLAGEYVCEIETYGAPMHQTSSLEILGEQTFGHAWRIRKTGPRLEFVPHVRVYASKQK